MEFALLLAPPLPVGLGRRFYEELRNSFEDRRRARRHRQRKHLGCSPRCESSARAKVSRVDDVYELLRDVPRRKRDRKWAAGADAPQDARESHLAGAEERRGLFGGDGCQDYRRPQAGVWAWRGRHAGVGRCVRQKRRWTSCRTWKDCSAGRVSGIHPEEALNFLLASVRAAVDSLFA